MTVGGFCANLLKLLMLKTNLPLQIIICYIVE